MTIKEGEKVIGFRLAFFISLSFFLVECGIRKLSSPLLSDSTLLQVSTESLMKWG